MNSAFVTLAISLFLASSLAPQAAARSAVNPCHADKFKQGKDVTCEKVVLPKSLCKHCKLRPFRPNNGQFVECDNIYDLNDPDCRKALRKYARLNADCDPVRLEQVKRISVPANRNGLDYFVYSVCEQCCDCVPRGAERTQYKARRDGEEDGLLLAERGNCPAHAFYDICKVWPSVRTVVKPKDEEDKGATDPAVCPLLTEWIKRPENQRWVRAPALVIEPAIKNFLENLVDAAGCSRKHVWKACVDLETAQNRL